MLSRLLLCAVISAAVISAAPLQATFSSCESNYNAAAGINRLNVSSVYADLVPGYRAAQLGLAGEGSDVLRVDVFGTVGSTVVGFDESTNKLATLFTDTSIGGISVYKSASWVCNSIFPATLPNPYTPFNTTYCPLPAGPFALNLTIPLYRSYALTTLSTQVRIVDTSISANTLSCVNITFTPYNHDGWYYHLFLWLPAALVAGFWATSWGARFAAGWVVGSGVAEYGVKDQHGETRGKELDKAGRRDARMRKWGTMLVSGLSGERLSVSSGLLRFVTPGLRDIMYHIQFCTMLVMIAVTWPGFAYPIVAKLAWADLVWNSTIISGNAPRVSAYPTNATLPSAFSTQISDSLYPLYLDTNTFNPLLDLGTSASGIESFASAVGLSPQDLFGTCLVIFCIIAAAIIIISVLIWVIHATTETFSSDRRRTPATPVATKRQSYGTGSASPSASVAGDKLYDPKSGTTSPGWSNQLDQLPITTSQEGAGRPARGGPTKLRRAWWRFRPKGEAGAFHAAALYGNLLRLILIFHLPITIFSTYQLVLGSRASIVSRVFAALALVFISILIPAGVMWKVYNTPSGKLYDATRTLLAMGTMYNHYVMDKQLFRLCPLLASLVTGIVVGAGQGSGIAQAVIVVVVELIMLVAPALWYPWGEGASMGAPSVFKGVIRVISALLVMLLSPVFSMTEPARVWIAYTVLLLNAIVFLFFLFMLLTKIVEGLIRLSGGVHFDESTHPLDGGIFAAIADLDCLNGVTGGKAAARKRRKRGSRQLQRNVSAQGNVTTQRMLDKYSQGMREPASPEYDTPGKYPSPYPRMSEGYFPTVPMGVQPPLGPPPAMERHSSDSRTEELAGGGNIMDAWRTRSNEGYITPATPYAPSIGSGYLYASGPRLSPPANGTGNGGPSRSFSVVRGGRADIDNPYDVQMGSGSGQVRGGGLNEFGRSLSPPVVRVSHATMPSRPIHQREYSSPVIIESLDAATPGVYGPVSPGGQYSTYPINANKRHSGSGGMEPVELVPLRPPEMTIPKRRSLNDLKNEAESAASEDESESARGKGKGKEKSGKRMWFSRTATEDTEESDDEPGPSRRRRGTSGDSKAQMGVMEMGYEGGEEKRGWRKKLGLGRKVPQEEDDEMRDENKARKDALANESGALFAGVDSPVKQRPKGVPASARWSRSSQAVGPAGSGSGDGGGGKKGFVVHRKPQSPSISSSPLSPPLSTGRHRTPLIPLGPIPTPVRPGSDEEESQPRSFRVKRMNRPTPTPVPSRGTGGEMRSLPGSTKASPQGLQAGTMDKVVYPPPPASGRKFEPAGGADSEGSDGGGKRSFRVIRQALPGAGSRGQSAKTTSVGSGVGAGAEAGPESGGGSGEGRSSFVVHRSTDRNVSSGAQSTTEEVDVGGYSADAFVPYGSAR